MLLSNREFMKKAGAESVTLLDQLLNKPLCHRKADLLPDIDEEYSRLFADARCNKIGHPLAASR